MTLWLITNIKCLANSNNVLTTALLVILEAILNS